MKHLKVLLVEDDLDDAAQIRGMLRRCVPPITELIHATSLKAAMPSLERGDVDLVLLDLSLPDSWGLEAIDPIRTTAPDRPVIVLTGNDDHDVAVRAVNVHAQDYLVKWSFNEQMLSRSIHYAIERHRIRVELEAAKQLAEAANRAKTEFLANISHELRTPLTAVLGMTELLSETSLSPEQEKFLRTLRSAGVHLRSLIDDVLDLGRIEAGQVELEVAPFDLHTLARGTVEFLAVRANRKAIELRAVVEPDVPVWVQGDMRRLRQVLVNLLGNAIKFTERGYVELRVSLAAGEHGANPEVPRVRFAIEDTGIGIPAAQLGRIFDRFAQADSSLSRSRSGSGLGLAIAQPLVIQMGGKLEVESVHHRGSTFSFALPLPVAIVPSRPRGVTPPSVALVTRATRGMRILAVDDAEDNRWLLESYLRGTPHTVELAVNGAEAYDRFTRARFDLVLLDMHMPVMDGPTAVKKMREWEKQHERAPTPVLALTADVLSESLARFFAAGCDAHLGKPFTKAELFEALARYGMNAPTTELELTPSDRSILVARPDSVSAGPSVDRLVVRVDPELFPMMPRFLGKRAADVDQILAALSANDFEQIWTIGHNMKGSAAGYQLAALGELGNALATAAKQKDGIAVAKLARELSSHLQRIDVVCGDDLAPA